MEDLIADTGLAVLSPGVPTDLPVSGRDRKSMEMPIWGEDGTGIPFWKGQTCWQLPEQTEKLRQLHCLARSCKSILLEVFKWLEISESAYTSVAGMT